MYRRDSKLVNSIPSIFTDYWRPSHGLHGEILRFGNDDLLGSQVGKITDNNDRFSVSINARNFARDEITVKVETDELKIEGLHADKNGKKQFERRYKLPTNAVNDHPEINMDSNGILTITLLKNSSLSQSKTII